LLAGLTGFLDHALIIKGVGGVNIKGHQIPLELPECCQLLGMVGLEEQEASSTLFSQGYTFKALCASTPHFFHLVMRFQVIEARLVNSSLWA
jgi:arginine exporter protein ArgO